MNSRFSTLYPAKIGYLSDSSLIYPTLIFFIRSIYYAADSNNNNEACGVPARC